MQVFCVFYAVVPFECEETNQIWFSTACTPELKQTQKPTQK